MGGGRKESEERNREAVKWSIKVGAYCNAPLQTVGTVSTVLTNERRK